MLDVLVVGDITEDIDDVYEKTKERDGYPVLERRSKDWRWGCASAVRAMVAGMGVKAGVVADFEPARMCVKRRLIVDNKVYCRLDTERAGQPIPSVPEARIVLVADYMKGAVDETVISKIQGKEVIADWHPGRPREFYHNATALKVSWDATPDHRPFIRTMGEHGMLLVADGQEYHWSAKTKAKDPCGAGDMVLATLGAGRALGLSWQECCEWATDNAAWVCGQWGSVPRDLKYADWKYKHWVDQDALA